MHHHHHGYELAARFDHFKTDLTVSIQTAKGWKSSGRVLFLSMAQQFVYDYCFVSTALCVNLFRKNVRYKVRKTFIGLSFTTWCRLFK